VDEILMDIYEREPDVVCFSCYLWNVSYVEQITAELAKILPETRIWLGGPEVSYRAEEILRKHPELDRKSTRLNSSHVSISYAVFHSELYICALLDALPIC